MADDQYVEFRRGLRAAAKIVEDFAKKNPNCVLVCEDLSKEIKRRAQLAGLRKPRQPKPETPNQ